MRLPFLDRAAPAPESRVESRIEPPIEAALRTAELRGLELMAYARLVTLAAVALFIATENPFPAVLFFEAQIAGFVLAGLGPFWLVRAGWGRSWPPMLFTAIDYILFPIAFYTPNPWLDDWLTLALRTRLGNEVYLFLPLAGMAITGAPRLVLWAGLCAALSAGLSAAWIVNQPDIFTSLPDAVRQAMTVPELRLAFGDPNRFELSGVIRLVFVLLLATGLLAVAAARARGLARGQAASERARTNLARYFSANMVETLARADRPFDAVRRQDAAVLFVDIVGFTRLAEALSADATIALLRDFHGRVEQAVFAHDGTLDKYLGDGAMATFGTPTARPGAAHDALAAALELRRAMAEWNAARAAQAEPPIRIGIGVHWGPIVLGDIGGGGRFEFATVGDTVNVAARLERLTREVDAEIVVSAALADAARADARAAALLKDFTPLPAQALRNRAEAIDLLVLGRTTA